MEGDLVAQSFSRGDSSATLVVDKNILSVADGDAQPTLDPSLSDNETLTDAERAARRLAVVSRRLEEDQASDVVTVDLDGKSDVADALVIASGRSARHVAAIADKLARDLKEAGFGMPAIEGLPAADWVLLDAGDVIVHLFRPEVREFYNLERIWAPELFRDAAAEKGEFSPKTDALEVTTATEEA